MDRRIAEYISANRRRYTREAIRQQLIDAGYAADEIDATWAVLDTPDPDEPPRQGFWTRFWVILVAINVAVFLLVAFATGLTGWFGTGAELLLVILAVALALGALIAFGIVAATRPATLGRRSALVIGTVIPLVFALLIGGSCYALVGRMGTPPPPPRSGVMDVRIEPPLAFQGSGSAACHLQGDAGFSIFSENTGALDGEVVSVSVDAHPMSPGGTPIPNVLITVGSGSMNVPPLQYGEMGPPGDDVELDAAPDGLAGTVTFHSLEPITEPGPEPAAAPTPIGGGGGEGISGTVSWQCE